MEKLTYNSNVSKSIVGGGFKPHRFLTNMSVAYFQEESDFVAPSIFPVVPVQLSSGQIRIFNRGDLARDNFQEKPEFGSVNPAQLSTDRTDYNVRVDQMIMGIDEIQQVNNNRLNLPGSVNPMIGRTRAMAEQAKLHMDAMWAQKFFQTGVWENEYSGNATDNLDGKKFKKLSNKDTDPLALFNTLKRMRQPWMRRRFNTLVLGTDAYDCLCMHPVILERIRYGASAANPATVTENVLAQLFGVSTVKVLESTMNMAAPGEAEDMQFICDPKSMLFAYVDPNPSVDSPTAGLTLSWDPTGNGQPLVVQQFEGRPSDHANYMEALCAYDMKITCNDMGLFLKDVC